MVLFNKVKKYIKKSYAFNNLCFTFVVIKIMQAIIQSKHFKPRSVVPDSIIIHSMAEYIRGVNDLSAVDLLNELKLSAHYLITPSGVSIFMVDPDNMAWHAKGFNTKSIGIEFLVPGVYNYDSFLERIKKPYVYGEQYTKGVKLCRELVKEYDIKKENFLRHSDVDPDRKSDPGEGFPWDTFVNDVYTQ